MRALTAKFARSLPRPDPAPSGEGLTALAESRLKNAWDRLIFAVVLTLAAVLLLGDALAWLWLGVQALIHPIDRLYWRRFKATVEQGLQPHRATMLAWMFVVAGAYNSFGFILWRHPDSHGDYAAALMLTAAALNAIVSLRGQPALTLIAVSTTVAVILLGPFVAGGGSGPNDGLMSVIGAGLLIGFILMTWRRLDALNALEARGREAAETARRQAEAAARAKSQFITTLSLELRTPLSALLGSAQMLRRETLSPPQDRHVRAVLESGEVLMAVLNDALDMGRIEAGAVRISPAPASPAALARSVTDAWRARADEKWLELFLDVAPGVPAAAQLDPTRVKQVLHNMIGASVMSTRHGGVRVKLSAAPLADNRVELVFEVVDTGPGLDAEAAELLLTGAPVPRAAEAGGGLDLGLAITGSLARLMGGQIAAHSAKGVGTRLTFMLPAALAAEGDLAPQSFADAAALDGRLEALVADDHHVSARVIALLLEQLGARVTTVSDGEAALRALSARRFDIVFLDLQMPEADGFEVARLIRAGGPNRRTPIVALTAAAMGEDKRRCLEAGMDGHVAKPIDPMALARELNRLVGARLAA